VLPPSRGKARSLIYSRLSGHPLCCHLHVARHARGIQLWHLMKGDAYARAVARILLWHLKKGDAYARTVVRATLNVWQGARPQTISTGT
jgi:hypothetical protein